MPVEQHVSPRHIAARLQRLGVPQATLAEFADVSPTQISLWFSGERGLSTDAQVAVLRAMKFFDEMAEEAAEVDLSFNFADVPGLQKRWTKFLRVRAEAEIIRTREELHKENPA